MTTTHASLGWKVRFDGSVDPTEENQWVVIDAEGDDYDWFDTQEDAIECCNRHAREEACERLAEEIAENVGACEDLDTLKKIAKLLGI